MKLIELNPYVRFASLGAVHPLPQTVRAYDARLFYLCAGNASMDVDGRTHFLSPGALLILPQGTPYRFNSYADVKMIDLNFDYDARSFEKTTPFPVVPEGRPYTPELRFVPFADCEPLSHPLILEDMETLEAPLLRLYELYCEGGVFSSALVSSALKDILLRAARSALSVGSGRDDISVRLPAYVREHCCEPLSAPEVARIFGYHEVHLNRIMHRSVGMTLHRYVIHCRMEQAKTLLSDTDESIDEIALKTGFRYPSYFSDLFRRTFGVSASTYRTQHRHYL